MQRESGPGGWGVYLVAENNAGEVVKEENLLRKWKKQTNKQWSLQPLTALESLTRKNVDITVFTDSKYVIDGITKWIFGWLKNNWSTASKKLVANRVLWETTFNLTKNQNVDWVW